MDREQKIKWLIDIEAGRIRIKDFSIKHFKTFDVVAFYRELKNISYSFIDGIMVSAEEFEEQHQQKAKMLGVKEVAVDNIFIGSGTTTENISPLPKYFKRYKETERATFNKSWYNELLDEERKLDEKHPGRYSSHRNEKKII